MADLSGVKLRLERAAEHLDALRHGAQMFMLSQPQPYNFITDPELPSGECIVRAKINRLPDARLSMLVADAVHNLRAALDMIAWELARSGPTPPPDDDTTTAFPICSDAHAWESNSTKRMIKWLPRDAVNLIQNFQPYNRPEAERIRLTIVQAIDNWTKHKALPNLFTFHVSNIRVISAHGITKLNFGAFNDGDELCTIRRTSDSAEEFKAEVMCHIGLSKDPPGYGCAIDALSYSHSYIADNICPTFAWFFGGYAAER